MAAKQPHTLREAILFFADYENCKKAVEAIRWPDGIVKCPTCGSDKVTYLANQRRWKCYEQHPKAQFSLKVGTIFEDSPIGLEKWLPALWLITTCKNGISSYELARALGVTQKTAWFMLSRLRLALQSESGGKFGGDVEVDETYIGGKARNMSSSKKRRLGFRGKSQGFAGKVAVMGLLERHGADGQSRVITRVVQNSKRSALQPIVRACVTEGANVYTDALMSYYGLDRFPRRRPIGDSSIPLRSVKPNDSVGRRRMSLRARTDLSENGNSRRSSAAKLARLP